MASVKPPNPEAMDDPSDRWFYGQAPRPEPPERPSELSGLIVLAFVFVVGAIGVYACSAQAHMRDRPELDAWFESLKGSNGMPCCSQVDGSTLADVDWDTTVIDGKVHYRVRVEGQWVV